MRRQSGQVIRIGDRWYVRYWERRNVGGSDERKRVTHSIGQVTTRGKRPPADVRTEAERRMATLRSGTVPAERIVTIGDFVERVYLPWTEEHKRPSTAKGYRDIWEDHPSAFRLDAHKRFRGEGIARRYFAKRFGRGKLKVIDG